MWSQYFTLEVQPVIHLDEEDVEEKAARIGTDAVCLLSGD